MTVDFRDYLGLWYEIARYPNSFQNRNAAYAPAEYRLVGEMITIENR
jgi:lipocalin